MMPPVLTPEVPPVPDKGQGDGSDVITIGDSWMSNTLGTGDGIEGALRRLTMQPYRNFGVQGVLVLEDSGFGPAIPSQYADAKAQNPKITTVLMTGGGNDIIQDAAVQDSCTTGGELCLQKIGEINAAIGALWTQMAADGVKDIVMVRYSADAGDTAPNVRMAVPAPDVCKNGTVRCHTLDSTEAVAGDLLADGIHPTRAANDRIAPVLVDLMVKQGIRR